jgi:hypothetical protein
MLFVEILWTDVQGGKFGKGRGTSKTAVLDIFDFIVRYQVLRYASNSQGKCLHSFLEYPGTERRT